MKVLACGGRYYEDSIRVCDVLGALHRETPIAVLIHGAAAGADRLAEAWARSMKVESVACPADWHNLGASAGPRRNQQMLDEQAPDLVVAFPGGRGTADMVRRAKAAGVRVIEVTDTPSAAKQGGSE